MRAELNGTVLAESDNTVVVEGNHYFPLDSIKSEYFSGTDHTTGCPWKGTAQYYSVTVDGETLENVAWYYTDPKEAAAEIKGRVAFYPAITVS